MQIEELPFRCLEKIRAPPKLSENTNFDNAFCFLLQTPPTISVLYIASQQSRLPLIIDITPFPHSESADWTETLLHPTIPSLFVPSYVVLEYPRMELNHQMNIEDHVDVESGPQHVNADMIVDLER